jgi:hypothetical protein
MYRWIILLLLVWAQSIASQENSSETEVEILQWITSGQPLQLGVASEFKLFSSVPFTKKQLPEFPKSGSHRLRWGSITTGNTSTGQLGVLAHVQAISIISGNIEIPPFNISVDSKVLTTPALTLIVAPATSSEDMVFEVKVPNGDLYVGEGFLLECEWTTTLHLSAIEALHIELPIARDPRFKVHFSPLAAKHQNEIGLPIESQRVIGHWKKVLHEGQPAHTISFQLILSANHAGKHSFSGPALFCSVPSKIPRLNHKSRWNGMTYPSYFNNSFFDKNGSSSNFVRLMTRAREFSLNVLPLPSHGQPEHFSGFVGKPKLQLIPLKQQLVEGESFECHLDIASSSLIPPPAPRLEDHPSYVHHFSWPESNLQTLSLGDSTLYRFQLTPLHAELQQIPPLLLHCFDPETQTYITVRSNSPLVQIEPAQDQQGSGLPEWFSQSSPPQLDHTGVWADEWGQMSHARSHETWAWIFIWGAPPLGCLIFLLQRWFIQLKRRTQPSSYHQRALKILRNWKIGHSMQVEQELHTLLLSILREGGFPLQAQENGSTETHPELNKIYKFNEWLNQKHKSAIATTGSESEEAKGSPVPKPQELMISLKKMVASQHKAWRGKRWAFFTVVFTLMACPSSLMSDQFIMENQDTFISKQHDLMALSHLAHQASLNEPHRGKELHRQLALKIEGLLSLQTHLKTEQPVEFTKLAFNAGNHWFHAEQLGRSILWYQRAQLITPHFTNLQHNLSIARQQRQDDLPVGFQSNVVYTTISPYLEWLKILFALVNLYVFIQVGSYIWLRTKDLSQWIYLASLYCVIGGIYGLTAWDQCRHQPDGIILSSSVVAKKGPSPIFAPAFTSPLNHGTELIILGEEGSWSKVKLSDQSIGWIPTRSLERF